MNTAKITKSIKKIISTLMVPLILTGCVAKPDPGPVDPPANLKYYYHDDDREIKVIWDTVDVATGYEIKWCDGNEENWQRETITDTIYHIKDVDQGDSGKIYVRALGSDGGCSPWSQIEYEVEIYITAPKTVASQLDGKYNYVVWEPVDGASGYEVKCFDEDGNETEVMKIEAPVNYFREDRRTTGKRRYDIRTLAEIGGAEYSSEWKTMTVVTPLSVNPENCTCFESTALDLDSLREYARRHNYTITTSKNGDRTIAEILLRDIEMNEPWIRLQRTNEGVMNRQPQVSGDTEEYFKVLDEEAGRFADYNSGRPGADHGGAMDPGRFDAYVICYYVYSDTELAPEYARIGMLKRYHDDLQTRIEQEFGQPKNGFYWMKFHGTEQKAMMSLTSGEYYWLIDFYPAHVM